MIYFSNYTKLTTFHLKLKLYNLRTVRYLDPSNRMLVE